MKHNWTYKKLGEVVTIERGGSPRPIQDYITTAENGLNWIKIGDAVEGSKYITSTKEKIKPEGLKKTRFVHRGDFILSNSMSFGRPYILGIDGCIHDGWLVLHDEKEVFDKSYLYYYLSSPSIYAEFKRLAVGGVVNNLNSDIVRKVKVAIPSKDEQQAIVRELDGINHLIDLQEEQLREYDRLAQSLFYTTFGDPATNPKGWEVKKLGEVATSELGKTLNQSKDTGVLRPYLCAINILWGEINIKTLKEARFGDSEVERYSVRKGDLLVCEGGETGRAAIWKDDEPMLYQNALHRVRFENSIVNTYALFWLQILKQKGEIDAKYSKGVTIKHLVKSALLSIPIMCPPLALQQTFAAQIEAIEQQKALIRRSLDETRTLLAARMQYYFE